MNRMKITEKDYVKANRKASREQEIETYGKPISMITRIVVSKKKYNRRRDRKIPSFFLRIIVNFYRLFDIYIQTRNIWHYQKF